MPPAAYERMARRYHVSRSMVMTSQWCHNPRFKHTFARFGSTWMLFFFSLPGPCIHGEDIAKCESKLINGWWRGKTNHYVASFHNGNAHARIAVINNYWSYGPWMGNIMCGRYTHLGKWSKTLGSLKALQQRLILNWPFCYSRHELSILPFVTF